VSHATPRIADAVMLMAGAAMDFGMIDRTACYHPDGGPAESDTDHTVMLGWIACGLARRLAPDLDIGLVAQLALAHDAVEVHAGDTQTLRISDDERRNKAEREHDAWLLLRDEFGRDLPWLPDTVRHYEDKASPEARFVWALDKTMPKLVHLLDNLRGLREFGMGRDELAAFFARQRDSIAVAVAGEPWTTDLVALHAELVRRVLAHNGWGGDQTLPA
jgi:putative hydrolase of HD superfamily